MIPHRETSASAEYCHDWSEAYFRLTDVVFVVQNARYAAHNQVLSGASRVICEMVAACPTLSK